MDNLIVNPAVRLFPPSNSRMKWTALDLVNKNNYSLSPLHIHILLKATSPITEDTEWDLLKKKYNLSNEEISETINALTNLNLLINEKDPKFSKIRKIKERWESLGWAETFDYHFLTLDYPFVDYKTSKGLKADALRMRLYEQEKADKDRYKEYNDINNSVKCDDINLYLSSLNTHFPMNYGDEPEKNVLDDKAIKKLATSVFGILRKRAAFAVKGAEELLRKTSPSGGARHPTELYVMVINVDGLESGLYHYNMGKNSLDFIKDIPESGYEKNLEGLYRIQEEPQALFFMTSLFARNRYRYREPRTLRTLYIDVGHLSMTLKFVAESLGLECFFHHGVNEKWLENYIGISEYKEAFILGASLKGATSNEQVA